MSVKRVLRQLLVVIRGMEMSSTTQPQWAPSNYFKGALMQPSNPWKLSSFLQKEICGSSPLIKERSAAPHGDLCTTGSARENENGLKGQT